MQKSIQLRLGEILLDRKLITEEQIKEATRLQIRFGKRIGTIVVEKGWVSEHDMLAALSEKFAIPLVFLRPGLYDPDILPLLDKATALRLEVLPLFRIRGVLIVATCDPQAIPSLDEVGKITGLKVKPVLAIRSEIVKSIEEGYAGIGGMDDYVGELDSDFTVLENVIGDDHMLIDNFAEGSPIINLVNSIIQRAVMDGASDIHIEPSRLKCRMRLRIDGVLYEVASPKIEVHAAMVSRLKVMAGLDIAERRLPQDGRIQVNTRGNVVDLRFSSLPGIFGEKIVLRVLDKSRAILDINKLGMTKKNLLTYKKLLSRNNGLVLVTGPTGSGKSTTLYAAITYLNCLEKNIVTIEDPVEYQLDIVNQNQVKEAIGLGFAKMLKHVLRQDPDIIMVGEIRERETAEIAVQAALTGHLVLSTLHTNESVGAVSRLMEMGIEPYLLSSALIGVISQRLVRSVCDECTTSFLPTPEVAKLLDLAGDGGGRLQRGRGCRKCYDSGYKGRLGIHEILEIDSGLQRLINTNPSSEEMEGYVRGKGFISLMEDGYDRVRNGKTTLEEITHSIATR